MASIKSDKFLFGSKRIMRVMKRIKEIQLLETKISIKIKHEKQFI